MTWVDWILLVLILLFALRGLARGTVSQVFGILGLVLGLGAAGWISQWVGHHWHGARPAVVFLVLRWLVAGLGGLAVASLFQWWGERLGEAARGGAIGWLDRAGGLLIGAALGVVVSACVVLAALSFSIPGDVDDAAGRARMSPSLLSGGQRVCAKGGRYFPGSTWLGTRFESAGRRASRTRSASART